MNELSEIFKAADDGECITLENKIYEIAPEDSFHLKGFFFSNTAKYEENPDGERFCAIYLDGKSDITIDGNITFENNTVINCAARYSAFGDDVIRYEPVVMDKNSTAPVHKKLILKNNRFISGTGRNYFINLNYLEEAIIEGNTSDVGPEVINYRKAKI